MYEHEVSKSVPKNNSNKISNSPPWDCYILIPHFSPKKRTRQERDEVKKPLENGFKNFSKRRRQEFNGKKIFSVFLNFFLLSFFRLLYYNM